MPASLCEEERPGTEKKRHREEAGEDGGERDGVPDSRELGEAGRGLPGAPRAARPDPHFDF